MAFKIVLLVCSIAAAQAGIINAGTIGAYPEITSQQQNIYRSFGNEAQISTHSKTIDTPFSSVSKSDVRVSNPGYAKISAYSAPLAYAAPHAPLAYAAPQAPLAYAAPHAQIAYAAPHAPLAYSAPHAPLAYSAPHATLLGTAYSAAPAVAHFTYTDNLGLAYQW